MAYAPTEKAETQDQVNAHKIRKRWNSLWSENESNGQGIYLSAERCLCIKRKDGEREREIKEKIVKLFKFWKDLNLISSPNSSQQEWLHAL